MTTNQLLKDWWRYKAKVMAPDFNIEAWLKANGPERTSDLEQRYICRAADGLLYGNWPWVKT